MRSEGDSEPIGHLFGPAPLAAECPSGIMFFLTVLSDEANRGHAQEREGFSVEAFGQRPRRLML